MNSNSSPYASFQERQEWLKRALGNISRNVDILYPLLAQVQLSSQEIVDLQSLALSFIAHSLGIPGVTQKEEILRKLEDGPFSPDRQGHEWLIPLERRIVEILHELKIHERVLGLEYPINIRVVHGKPFESFKRKSYPTNLIHTDVWAGEPADTIQLLIPILGNVEQNYCQWYKIDEGEFDSYVTNYADYKTAGEQLTKAKAISHGFEIGKMYVFDSAMPHRTVQQGGGVRISLDIRVRRLFPYADPAWLPRMRRDRGAYSRYYTFPGTPYAFSNFKMKLDREIELLENLGFASFASIRRQEGLSN